ncbi:MAG: tRNA 2-thiouridine(34) synthase MnmA [Bacteroidales bacterium]|nr:tRNA 2-thiouridine(34) synthase MnmA [Bacteroidales bacterium]
MPRVVLAMSGGVDSSAAAILLQRQGYEVIGLFMRTGVHSEARDARPDNKKGCCSAIDAGDARRVADKLDIPFYALDFEAEFGKIIDYFADEYLRGRTPNPCVVCNTWLKFGELWKFAQQLGADAIATGHYAQILRGPSGEPELHRGADPDKDQSYVLYGIRRDVLPHLLFPVGGYTKPAIRAMAQEAGLTTVAAKPDSVEICFVPSGNHTDVVRQRRPDAVRPGVIREKDGTILGPHDGYDRFTVGQRKGLGVAAGRKRFVLEVIPETREVIVGDESDLLASGLIATEVNWLCVPPTATFAGDARIRYRHESCPATIVPTDHGAEVHFANPQPAVTPGQAVVFYEGSRVLGGGWIDRAIKT